MTDNERNKRGRPIGTGVYGEKMVDRFEARFPPHLAKKLREAAKSEGLRPGQFIRTIVTEALE